jgi:hypothetical protein
MTQPLTLDGVEDDLDTVKDIMITLARQCDRCDAFVISIEWLCSKKLDASTHQKLQTC